MNYFEILEQSLEYLADFRYDFFRDETDTYQGKIQQLSDIKVNFQASDCLLFVPSGSKWKQQLGAVAYFGLPFYLYDRYWLGIGQINIVPHQTRNAYPLCRVYVFKFNKYKKNEKVVRGLQNLISLKGTTIGKLPTVRTGINSIWMDNKQLMQQLEVSVLQKGMGYYKKGKLMYFSSYLLSEDMHPKKLRNAFKYLDGINEEIAHLFTDSRKYIVIKNTNHFLFGGGRNVPETERRIMAIKKRERKKGNVPASLKMPQFFVWLIDYIKRILN